MQKYIYLLITFFFALTSKAELSTGLYTIQGHSSVNGAYTGHIQIYENKILRQVRFDSSNIETIWEGQLNGSFAQFSLKPTNVLTTYQGFTVSDEELRHPLIVTFDHSTLATQFDAGRDGQYSEVYTLVSQNPGAPIWVNQRQKLNARGDDQPFLIKAIRALGVDMVIDWYRNVINTTQPEFAQRPEYVNEEQWQIFDPTDSDFYRQNPNILRITNKTINPLSITEAKMRRNAYAPTLAEKANLFEQQTYSMHLNDAGMLEMAVVDANGNKIRSSIEGDSCLWTGVYIWSQVMRYEQTQDPQALLIVQKAMKGLLTLIDITGDPKDFARTLIVSPASENLGSLFVQGKGQYSHLKWIPNGNNDMSKGLTIAFSSAYKLLKQKDPALFAQVAAATRRLPDFESFSKSIYNKAIAQGLIALYSDKVELAAITKFKAGISGLESAISYKMGIDFGIHWKSVVDMSCNHLAVMSTLSALFTAQNLKEKLPSFVSQGFYLSKTIEHYKDILRKIDSVNRPGHRGYETIVAYAATKDPALKQDAMNGLWCLKEIPFPRNLGAGMTELKRLPDWSYSSWPIDPWGGLSGLRKLKPDIDFERLEQSAFGYPTFETISWQTTYYWKESIYFTSYRGSENYKSFSSDYLVIYWLARTAGLLSPAD